MSKVTVGVVGLYPQFCPAKKFEYHHSVGDPLTIGPNGTYESRAREDWWDEHGHYAPMIYNEKKEQWERPVRGIFASIFRVSLLAIEPDEDDEAEIQKIAAEEKPD